EEARAAGVVASSPRSSRRRSGRRKCSGPRFNSQTQRRRRHRLSDTKNTKEAKRTKALVSAEVVLGQLCSLRVLLVTLTAPAAHTRSRAVARDAVAGVRLSAGMAAPQALLF